MPLPDPRRQHQLEKLILRLGLSPSTSIRWDLLDLALTHSSFAPTANYEQLEFVGDAVVRLVTAQFLWQSDPAGDVGEWSAIRSVLVSDRTLAELAQSYGLERFLRLAPSAARDARGEESRLAEAFEALLAALYLSSQDLQLICPWLYPQFERLAQRVRTDPAYQNYKAALQSWTQAHYRVLPEYRVQEIAPQTNLTGDRFAAEVWLQGEKLGEGKGRSIKAAEKAAAEVAFLKLQAKSQA